LSGVNGLAKLNNTVLIVNSDASVLRSFSSIFIKAGYKVETTQDAEEALEKVLKHPFDVIIIDSWLPGTDITDFLMKLSIASKAVKVLVTDFSPEDFLFEGSVLDIDVCLAKPVKIPELLSLIEKKLKTNKS
jgi:DNA-binding response OmpR family regulator